jgi:hypothetical protein
MISVLTAIWWLCGASQQLLSYGRSNRSKGKKKTHHDSVDWKSKRHNSLWIPFPMDALYIRHLFHTILQYVSYRLDSTYPFCYPSFPLSFCLQLSILTLGPYSSYVRCSPISFFAVSGCMTYIICPCPLYHFRR